MPTFLQTPQPTTVKATILLAGGHQCTLEMGVDNPLLQDLLKVLVSRSQKQDIQPSTLFQIPINNGQSSLYFPSEHLVGIVTEPPIAIENLSSNIPLRNNLQSQSPPQNIIASPYLQLENFLTPAEVARLLEYVFSQESAFVSSSTFTNQTDYRKSLILHSFPQFSESIVNCIRTIMSDILAQLGLPSFSVTQIESQLTAHNDGHYYKLHNDNGSPDTASRELTYVYYFYRQPKPFSGGELLIYDSKIENGYYVKADSFSTVEPRHNSIIFFPSRCLHEVLPISCPSKLFADSRFTINGWINR